MDYFLVFIAMFVLDFAFGFYTRKTSEGAEHSASFWATIILLLNGYVITAYVDDIWLIIPAAIGAYWGTYAAIKIDKKLLDK